MGLAAFDPDSSTRSRESGQGSHDLARYDPREMDRAIADLLQKKSLSQTCGVQGEWEVRTTLILNRRAWHYQSRVYVHGKEARKSFPPIDVVRTRRTGLKEDITEEALTAFAKEAAEVHFARCASVMEYAVMAAIFAEPASGYHRLKTVVLVLLGTVALLGGAAFLTMDRWRQGLPSIARAPLNPQPPSPYVRWQTLLVSYQTAAGEPFVFPLPPLEHVPNTVPVEITLAASGDQPSWVQFDRERLQLFGTAPATTEDQTYRLIVRAHIDQGTDSLLHVLLAIKGQPVPIVQTPQLPGHWTW